jgi:hypothetical protein
MKKFLSMLMITAAVAVAPAFAQSANLRATVEHDFVVNGKMMPAGEYRLIQNSGSEFAMIRTAGGGSAALVMTQASRYTASEDAYLAFRNVDGKHYLAGFGGVGGARDVRNSPEGSRAVLSFVKAARVR